MKFYVVGFDEKNTALAWIDDLPEVVDDNEWMLHEGMKCIEWFPEYEEFQICQDSGILLADVIPTYSKLLLVSEKLKSILESHKVNCEYFAVAILDKNGRRIDKKYFIVNVLDVVDCIDIEKSSFEMNCINKDQVLYFDKLVLDVSKVPEDKSIFRLKDKTDQVIINHMLARKLLDAGCTGIDFQCLEDNGSVHRN